MSDEYEALVEACEDAAIEEACKHAWPSNAIKPIVRAVLAVVAERLKEPPSAEMKKSVERNGWFYSEKLQRCYLDMLAASPLNPEESTNVK